MVGIPIIHLGPDRPPSPRPLPFFELPIASITPSPLSPPATPTPAPVKRYKSILKKMAIPITWGDPPHSTHHMAHNKLHKDPPKNVHFTPPPSAHFDPTSAVPAETTPLNLSGVAFHSEAFPVEPIVGLPTLDVVPIAAEKKKKKGGLAKLLGPKAGEHHAAKSAPMPEVMPLPTVDMPSAPPDHSLAQARSPTVAVSPSPLGQSDEGGTESWHHHASYFPEYEPIHPPATAIPGLPGVHNHTTYFPDYEPILHHSHPLNAYPGASGALAYALTTPEAEAAKHAARVGHSVSIHYPDLPRFAEYQSVGGAPGWQGNKWGVDGWTGYGWQGERLPSVEGLTFGAPMSKGVPVPTEADLKKQKEKEKNAQKDKDGGEGGDDGEDKPEGEEGKDGGEAGEGAEGGGDGGGGGGGGGKKKKKKKKS